MAYKPTKCAHAFPQDSLPKNLTCDLEKVLNILDVYAKRYPMKALAGDLGKRYTTLANEMGEQPGWKLGFADALRIIVLTRCFEALDEIEHGMGRVAFPVPSPSASPGTLALLTGKLTREFGEHMASVGTAMEDGEISPQEAAQCLQELRDVIEACMRLQAYLERMKCGSC